MNDKTSGGPFLRECVSFIVEMEQPYIKTYKNPRYKGLQQDVDASGARPGKQEVPVVMLENNSQRPHRGWVLTG